MKKIKIMWKNGCIYSQAFKKRHVSQIINEHFYRDDIVYLSTQRYPLKNNDEVIIKDQRERMKNQGEQYDKDKCNRR